MNVDIQFEENLFKKCVHRVHIVSISQRHALRFIIIIINGVTVCFTIIDILKSSKLINITNYAIKNEGDIAVLLFLVPLSKC